MKDIFYLLSNVKKGKLIVIIIFLQITSILDILSLALIIPIMHIIINPDSLNSLRYFDKLAIFLKNYSKVEMLYCTLFLFAFINILKSSSYVYINYKIHEFAKFFNQNVSSKILFYFLNSEYEEILNKKSSSLIRNITEETERATYALINFLSLISETLLLIFVFCFIFYIDYISVLIVITSIIFGIIILKVIVKNKLELWGKIRQKMFGERLTKIIDSAQSVVEIKLLNKIQKTKEEYHNINEIYFDKLIKYLTVLTVPRFVVEFFSILGISIALGSMLYRGMSSQEILNTLAILVAGSLRLLPGASKIYSYIMSFSFSSSAVKIVNSELKKINTFSPLNHSIKTKISLNHSIILKGIYFKYKNSKIILNKLSLNINRGDIYGITGGSGSGKSTLIKIIMGILRPYKGDIYIDTQNLHEKNENKFKFYNKLSYVPQSVYLFNDTIKNNICLNGGKKLTLKEQDRLKQIIEITELYNFVNELPQNIETLVGENGIRISGGQKQRIGIARALYLNREILILDEATNALDIATEFKILHNIKNHCKKFAIIMISHRINNYKICNKIFNLDKKINK